jgi:hypothetical protein
MAGTGWRRGFPFGVFSLIRQSNQASLFCGRPLGPAIESKRGGSRRPSNETLVGPVTRMKEGEFLRSLQVESGRVVGFVPVAGHATQRQIREIVAAALRGGDDVLDVIGRASDDLRRSTILATGVRALRHEHPDRTTKLDAAGFLVESASSSNHDASATDAVIGTEFSRKGSRKKLTPRARHKAMRRRSVTTVGTGDAEVKIYTIHRKDGYPSFQCAWYDLGSRKRRPSPNLMPRNSSLSRPPVRVSTNCGTKVRRPSATWSYSARARPGRNDSA